MDGLPFSDFFGEDVLLVPVPGSGITDLNALWPAYRLVKQMQQRGLWIGSPCLRRVVRIRKSAFCKAEDRPTPVEHFDTFAVEPTIHRPTEIVLVDDIVTRGSTLLGAASKLAEVFSGAQIRAFVVIRTLTGPEDFQNIRSPVTGTIRLRPDGQTQRRP